MRVSVSRRWYFFNNISAIKKSHLIKCLFWAATIILVKINMASMQVQSSETQLNYAITNENPCRIFIHRENFNLPPWPVNAPTINSLRRSTTVLTKESTTRLVNSSVSQNREGRWISVWDELIYFSFNLVGFHSRLETLHVTCFIIFFTFTFLSALSETFTFVAVTEAVNIEQFTLHPTALNDFFGSRSWNMIHDWTSLFIFIT